METGRPGMATWLDAPSHALKGAEFLGEFASERKVITSRILLIENMKVLAGQPYAPKTVGAARTSNALDQVCA